MKKLFTLLLAGLLSCQEEIRPVVDQNPIDPVESTGKFEDCVPALTNSTFDVATWNIENFPKEDASTISMLAEIITELDADLIAIQEIGDSEKFTELIDALPGWNGIQSGGSLGTGYLYKTSEVFISSATYPLVDASAFPRSPMVITATHVSGLVITFINLHLKCCDTDDSIDRRRSASDQLKAYIDANLSTANVVMLGDYNEDITQPEGNDVFENFVNDPDNYSFADMAIAEGSSAYWSYPGWPSHLDHMLITNELFDNLTDTEVLLLNECESAYYDTVSDHRPVFMRLQ